MVNKIAIFNELNTSRSGIAVVFIPCCISFLHLNIILICGILETFLHRKFSTFYHIWREAKITTNMDQIVKRILFQFLKMKVDI
jgi:hypothetical protein